MKQPGELAPSFELPDQSGTKVALDKLLADGPVVLFFFPAANTPVCTAESRHFRDLSDEFAKVGASRVGISMDSVEKLAGFAGKHEFDYPLLSDDGGAVAEQYGVKRGLLGKLLPVQRQTFVIDRDRTIVKVIGSELNAKVHADQALKFLRERQ